MKAGQLVIPSFQKSASLLLLELKWRERNRLLLSEIWGMIMADLYLKMRSVTILSRLLGDSVNSDRDSMFLECVQSELRKEPF